MKERIFIYFAGNIQKNHEKESKIFWTKSDIECLKKACAPTEVICLNPAERTDDLSDQHSVFGRDMLQVFISDFVLVDARERRGLGVGAEMMWAKTQGIPIITLAPEESHYRKNELTFLGQTVPNWVHPFVESLSDVLVGDLEEAAGVIQKFMAHEIEPKNLEHVKDAMNHYQKTQLPCDFPMNKLMEKTLRLDEKPIYQALEQR